MKIGVHKQSGVTLCGDASGWVMLEGLSLLQIMTETTLLTEALGTTARLHYGADEFAAPLRPGKIIAIGLNYRDHAAETGKTLPETPLAFAKLTSAIIGPEDPIKIPKHISNKIDYEAELAVVIGRTASGVSEDEALGYVFGYTIANDVTARDLQKSDGQWTRAKGMNTFCPLGPWIVSADEIPNPQALTIELRLNGETLQHSHTSQMVFSVAHIISHLSQWCTLDPGDVLLTGTPAGVGYARNPPLFLKPQDTVEISIESIGTLRNSVSG